MKQIIKSILDKVMRAVSLPWFLIYLVLRPLAGRRKAFGSIMQAASLWPGISGEWFRRGVLQWITGRPLHNCCISFGCLFSDPDLELSSGIYLGPGCSIGRTRIGENTILGSGVHVPSGMRQHGTASTDTAIRDQPGKFDRVCIGKNAWIGNQAVIMADVGQGCVIGAGSVVTRPVPDFGVAAGNPARMVRRRDTPPIKERNGQTR